MAAAKGEAGARPIIIKKKKIIAGGHHGGAWKVAYADFVTAMMAFFLLLWLLNVTTKEQKQGIGDFFSPTMAMPTGVLQTNPDIMNGNRSVLETPASSRPTPETETSEEIKDPGQQDPSEAEGEGETSPNDGKQNISEDDVDQAVAARDSRAFDQAKQQIMTAMQGQPEFKDLINNLQIDNTPEGLRIQLVDKDGRSLFQSGNSQMTERTRALLGLVAKSVQNLPNQLAISGHTDAHPYNGRGNFDNWDLSAARANASRRALVDAGLTADRINRVVGKGDGDPIKPDDPYASENRRISIVLLKSNLTAPGGPEANSTATDSGAVPEGRPVEATHGGPDAPPAARPTPRPAVMPAPTPIPD